MISRDILPRCFEHTGGLLHETSGSAAGMGNDGSKEHCTARFFSSTVVYRNPKSTFNVISTSTSSPLIFAGRNFHCWRARIASTSNP